jgi:nitrogenase molybdenum-iron protein beta chain
VVSALVDAETAVSAQKEPLTVNVFGVVPTQDLYWHGNLRELQRLLAGIGVKANVFFGIGQDSLAQFRSAGRASLNLFLSAWVGRGTERLLREKHGIQSLRFDSYPIGPTETTKFLRAVAAALGADSERAERFIWQEEDYVYDFFSGLAMFSSMRQHIAFVGDANTIVAAQRFLVNDFSQIPELAVVTDRIDEDEDRVAVTKAIQEVENHRTPDVIFETDQWYIRQTVENYRENITKLYGSGLDRLIAQENRLGYFNLTFPSVGKLVLDRAFAGYRGCIAFVEDSINRW